MTLKSKIKALEVVTLIEIFLLATILFSVFNITNAQAIYLDKNDNSINLDYTLHDPIRIINNGNFSDYGFPGDGQPSTPYIMENYNITDLVSGDAGILVQDTSAYFEIRNCYIFSGTAGIRIENVASGTADIINNTCRAYAGTSIYVTGSDNADIINNTCHLTIAAMTIVDSVSVQLIGNNCSFNGNGMELKNSPSLYVVNNTCNNNGGEYDDGIYVNTCDSSYFANNTCNNNGRNGIYVYSSNSLTFINNSFTNNDHGIYASTTGSEFTSNKFFYNENGLLVSGTNTVQDNLCIANYIGINGIGCASTPITNNVCYNNTIGIYVSGGHYGSTQDNNCSGNLEYGIWIENSLPPSIEGNTCNDNGKIGLMINNISGASGGGTIANNIFRNNGYLGLSIHHSEESDIVDNTFTNDGMGIFDGSVKDYLSYTVVNNIVNGQPFGYFKNLNNSLLFASSYSQLLFVNCHNLTIANHTLQNVGLGMNIVFSYNVTVANNTFTNINNYGLILTSSLNTTIIMNVFNYLHCGAYITSSYNTTLHHNWFSGALYGINIFKSANTTLTLNMIHDSSGIFMYEDTKEAYLTYKIEDCIVNGYPLGYLKSLSSSTITGIPYGQLILIDCVDTTVTGLSIDDTLIGLYLLYCDDIIVLENDFSNNYYGIYLSRTSNCEITENEINYNTKNGIFSSRSTNNLITYNNLRENYEYGIYLENYGDGNVIHHNNFYDNNLAQIVSYLLSQSFDGEDHQQNSWYDIVNQEGNYWSEGYDISIGYLIDGPDGARYDAYPLDTPTEPPIISEFERKNISIVLLVPMILLIQIIKKKRKSLKMKK